MRIWGRPPPGDRGKDLPGTMFQRTSCCWWLKSRCLGRADLDGGRGGGPKERNVLEDNKCECIWFVCFGKEQTKRTPEVGRAAQQRFTVSHFWKPMINHSLRLLLKSIESCRYLNALFVPNETDWYAPCPAQLSIDLATRNLHESFWYLYFLIIS